MRTKTALLSCCLIVFSIHLNAQSSVKAGFVLLQNGHTLKGDIKARSWHVTPQTIFFREKDQQEFVEYKTDDVKWYAANDDQYIRTEVYVDHRPVDYELDSDDMLPEHSIRLEKDTVFLKVLVLGSRYDLLELINFQKSHYYIRDSTGRIIPLEYKVASISNGDIRIDRSFRETLRIINFQEKDERSIEEQIDAANYFASSLAEIVEAINTSIGDVDYKYTNETRKKLSFFVGAAGGATVSLTKGNPYLKTGIGSMAGIIGGFDLSMGYSCNGGESFFRFDVLIARMLYASNSSSPGEHRIHESLQYSIVPSMQARLPLFTLENFQSHIGGGFKTPIHLSEKQKINQWKYTPSEDHFPWVAITVGGQIDFQIRKKWEIGLSAYQAPSVDFGRDYANPIHCYVWFAYRFN